MFADRGYALTSTAACCGSVGSSLSWPVAASPMAGLGNTRLVFERTFACSTSSSAYESATRYAPTCTSASFNPPTASFD